MEHNESNSKMSIHSICAYSKNKNVEIHVNNLTLQKQENNTQNENIGRNTLIWNQRNRNANRKAKYKESMK